MQKRLTDIISPNAVSISFCVLITLIFSYDLLMPQTTALAAECVSDQVWSPLFSLIEAAFPPNPFARRIVGLFFYLLIGFVILRLNETFSFIRVRTVLPSLFFLMIGSLLLPLSFSPGMIVALLVLLSVFCSFQLLSEENPKHAFNFSLLVFTAALFSFSCAGLLILFWVFLYANNIFTVRMFLASLLGAVVPVLFAVIGFAVAGSEQLLLEYVQNSLNLFAVDFHLSLPKIIYLVFLGFLALLSSVNLVLTSSQENIKPRKELAYLLLFFVLILVLIIFSVPDSCILLWLLGIFGSFLLGRFFSLEDNRFTRILFAIYFLSSLSLLFLH